MNAATIATEMRRDFILARCISFWRLLSTRWLGSDEIAFTWNIFSLPMRVM